MNVDDNISSFVKALEQSLKEGNTVHALTIFNDNKNSGEITNNSWDLIPVISRFLTEGTPIEVLTCAQKLIDIISEQSKPEEALLQFIEEIEDATDDTKLIALLKPLGNILLRVPEKRFTSLAWCFNAIQTYLNKMEIPEEYNLNEEERILMDTHPVVNKIADLYTGLIKFYDVFIEEIHEIKFNIERSKIISKYLLQMLSCPLAYLDMKLFKKTTPKARRIGESLVRKLFKIAKDPFIFFELRLESYDSDLIRPNDLGLGVFYYLIFSEGIHLDVIPKVYDKIYIFQNTLGIVCNLLEKDNQFILEKGLNLIQTLLQLVDNLVLSYLLLDCEDHSKFCKIITTIIIYNQFETHRKTALYIFTKYLWLFENRGRYLLICNLMDLLTHSSMRGFIITQYKEMLRAEISTNYNNLEKSQYYCGSNLFNLIEKFTALKDDEKTDLVEESSQIISTLNLFRYIFLADQNGYTEIWDTLPELEEFFMRLKNGILLSQAHYKLRKRELSEKKEKADEKTNVIVGGQRLSEIPTEKQFEIIDLSLTTLDVIDSLLCRVLECIEMQRNI